MYRPDPRTYEILDPRSYGIRSGYKTGAELEMNKENLKPGTSSYVRNPRPSAFSRHNSLNGILDSLEERMRRNNVTRPNGESMYSVMNRQRRQ